MERKRSIRRRQRAPFTERAKEHCRQFTAFLFSNVGIIILVVLYMIAGALMFIRIEGEKASERENEMVRYRQTLVTRLWNMSCCELNGFNRSYFETEIGNIILSYQKLIVNASGKGADIGGQNEWSFSGSLLYSLTVITTIGYGNMAPRTDMGKIATILYAIFGMPLFLLYLSNIGDILAKSFKWIYAKVCLCRICPGVARRRAIREKRKMKRYNKVEENINNDYAIGDELQSITSTTSTTDHQSIEDEEMEDEILKQVEINVNTVTVPLTICLMIMIGYIIMGATIFSKWEVWTPLDGCYFCFISLSSIGFGDIVPGAQIMTSNKTRVVELRFIVCAIYLLLGMALIAMCFNLMQEQVIHKIRSFKRGIRRCFHCDR